jgi:hypothetical protein
MTIALILIAIWVSVIIWAWAFKEKNDAPAMVGALLATGGLSFMTFLWSIMKENVITPKPKKDEGKEDKQ